jgi:hypothetical protein
LQKPGGIAAFLLQLKQWGIPGFRSGTPWKEIVASIGYVLFVIWLAAADGKRGATFFGLAVLLVALLAANGWNIRSRLPLLRSTSRRAVVGGWAVLASLLLFTWALAAASETPLTASNATSLARGSGGVGGGAPSTSRPEPASTLTLTPTATASLTPTPTPKPTPTPRPATPAPVIPTKTPTAPPPPPPPANTCGAPTNPWGYNFCGGNFIYSPPTNFCSYFNCIPSFWKSTNGYVEECVDNTFSHSGGRSGSCSYHGGNQRPLYGP